MKCCNAYENNSMREMMGETLRPGGFSLTEKGVEFCNFSNGDTVLDLGCGQGATVNYLKEKHGIKAVGIDPSEKLLDIARKKFGYTDFVLGTGEKIPFENESFQGVFTECTLSLMDDLDGTVREVFRILKNSGWFVITDVYAKEPEYVNKMEKFPFKSCMRGLHDLELLISKLKMQGFEIMLSEDCSHLLKEFLVKIVFSYGSMDVFWNKTTDGCIDGCRFQEILKVCKPGYFILIGRKGDTHHG
jgi:ubiquinone/menaquinone biosynthesis C-methylase UbiE